MSTTPHHLSIVAPALGGTLPRTRTPRPRECQRHHSPTVQGELPNRHLARAKTPQSERSPVRMRHTTRQSASATTLEPMLLDLATCHSPRCVVYYTDIIRVKHSFLAPEPILRSTHCRAWRRGRPGPRWRI